MTQYIDKDVVLQKINESYLFHKERGNIHDASICDVLWGLFYSINTLETREQKGE